MSKQIDRHTRGRAPQQPLGRFMIKAELARQKAAIALRVASGRTRHASEEEVERAFVAGECARRVRGAWTHQQHASTAQTRDELERMASKRLTGRNGRIRFKVTIGGVRVPNRTPSRTGFLVPVGKRAHCRQVPCGIKQCSRGNGCSVAPFSF